MSTSQELSGLPLEDLSRIDSAELVKIIQNFNGLDSSDPNSIGTASGIQRYIDGAAAPPVSEQSQSYPAPPSNTDAGVSQPYQHPHPQPTPAQTNRGPLLGDRPRGGTTRTTTGRGRGANHANTKGQGAASQVQGAPYVEIIEEPKTKGLRFRYECEGRSAGSIPGENSTNEKKTYPTIKIHNHSGPAVVVVSCVTKDKPYPKPHPHALVGKDCTKGVCTVRVRDTSVVKFPHLGIQCAKKKDVEDHIKQRKEINVDPFQTGFDHVKDIDLNIVRLCFQVFLPGTDGKFTRIIKPVCSNAILDKKAHNELVICRIDHTSGRARGGDEVFLLCEKVNKDDIGVRFYELNGDGNVVWEDYADFGQGDVHRQLAIVFRTPAYQDTNIHIPVQAYLQLRRPSDQEVSESIPFTYMPEDPDPHHIEEKRKRKCQQFSSFMQDETPGPSVNPLVKQRIKARASRKIKQEQADMDMPLPTYTISNIAGHGAGGMGYMGTTAASSNTAATTVNFSSIAHTSAGTVQVKPQPLATSVGGAVNTYFQQADSAQMAPRQGGPDLHMASITEGQNDFLLQSGAMNYQNGDPVITDINLGGTASSFDLSVLQEYLRDNPAGLPEVESTEMTSFGGLSGDLMTTGYDPSVAAMVSISSDTMENDEETQRNVDEVHRALKDLN